MYYLPYDENTRSASTQEMVNKHNIKKRSPNATLYGEDRFKNYDSRNVSICTLINTDDSVAS